jgi:TonB family protein
MAADLAMEMFLVAVKATVLLAFAGIFLGVMQARSTAASRHFVCGTVLAVLLVLPLTVFVPLSGAAANWPVFHIAIGSAAALPQLARSTNWPLAALVIWLCGAAIFALRLLAGSITIWKKGRQFVPFEDTSWTAGLSSSVTLRTGNIASPVACGVFSHTILLPESARHWDAFRRRTVLLHELAHIRRNDCLWQQISGWTCALFWFHPLVWHIAARLQREQELACDDLVLAAGVEPGAYASLLLNAAQELRSSALFACAFHGSSPAVQLRARVANILESHRNRRVHRHLSKAFATALGCVVLMLSSVTLARAEHIYRIGGDVTAPKLIKKVEPEYTASAKTAKIQGTTLLSVVIGKDGRIRKAQVEKSLDPGLDANAIKAVKTWSFEPAQRNGKSVAVQAKVEVNYRLK